MELGGNLEKLCEVSQTELSFKLNLQVGAEWGQG